MRLVIYVMIVAGVQAGAARLQGKAQYRKTGGVGGMLEFLVLALLIWLWALAPFMLTTLRRRAVAFALPCGEATTGLRG